MHKKKIKQKYLIYILLSLFMGQLVKFGEDIPNLSLLSSVEKKAIAYNDIYLGAEEYHNPANMAAVNAKLAELSVDRAKVERVRSYLAKRNAPLANHAEYMVRVADEFGLDYRLIPAISVIESNGGRNAYRPYNAWGWGGAAAAYTFNNWEESIYTVGRGLSRYYSYGRITPKQIAPMYNPHTPNEWSRKVSFVMSQM